jgi:cell division protein FtsB
MAKNTENETDNITQAQRKRNRKTGFYYSFLTIILVFCLIQIGYGAILNISNIISYQGKLLTLQNVLKQAKLHNQDLKAERKMITSDNSLEGIARNNLKMAGQDEVLIIINKKVEKPVKKEKKWYNKIFDKFNTTKPKTKEQKEFEMPYIPQTMDEE